MAKAKNYDLGDDVICMLHDFCEAHYGSPEVRVIREAIRFFIEDRLSTEPEMATRYEHARRTRLGENVTSFGQARSKNT